ncbi:MAG: GAF domain-containing protein [Candidatus Omnitrophica bacterium]|nr:GAF domain-containing protein [Candidatus Omnitrophota bacterium]MCG2704375.1 HD domain-containing protein [Candidatus Omnitrophota bacterium]
MKDSYQEEFFAKFIEHPSWRNEIETFDKFIGSATWLIYPHKFDKSFRPEKHAFPGKELLNNEISVITPMIIKTKATNQIQKTISANGRYFYTIPIIRGEQVYGYVGICNLRQEVPESFFSLFSAFTSTTIESVQKELEVSKLYETIRPKTIALSTVHTIGRIISSTLELSELLPRIARLSLQVLRARRCCIMLMDKYKRVLVTHAIVDLQKKNAHQSSLKVGQGIPGKVVQTGNAIIKSKYLCIPLIAEEHIIGAINISFRLDNKPFGVFDKEILTTLSEQAVIAIKNAQLYEEQEKLTLNSIKALASILSSGVADNYGRTDLFINIAMSIGMELKLRSDQMRMLYYASLLHNVSQMGLPEKILKKQTKLTGKDYKIIQEQHLKGAQLILPIGGRLKAVLPIIIHHHERYDGHGYPSGLKADDIPMGARILAVADAFEAMLSKRPYRKKMSLSKTVSEIVNLSGEQFDPVVVDAFVRVVKRSKNKILVNGKNSWTWKKF